MNKIVCRTCGRVSYGRMPSNYCTAKCRIRSPEYIERNRARLERTRRAQGRKKVKGKRVCVRSYKHICVQCEARFWSAWPKRTRCGYCTKRRTAAKARHCVTCRCWFTPWTGRGGTSVTCSTECHNVRAENQLKKSRRIGKAMRRARQRGADSEAVDPMLVFYRDKWICQICGSRTPQRKRGTHDPRAPELDHIVPLAMGGSHKYTNTQCACRECNQRKGASIVGQGHLFGMVGTAA